MQLMHLLACSYKIDENHMGKKLGFFHYKISSTANHEMKKPENTENYN
jgi:hypothetical protein